MLLAFASSLAIAAAAIASAFRRFRVARRPIDPMADVPPSFDAEPPRELYDRR